nr:hypothetical protein [Anaerolineae bacterium]
MANVLVSTLGLSPGVVTAAVSKLNEKPGIQVDRVEILYPERPDIVRGIVEVLRSEFEAGGRLQGLTLSRRPMAGVYDENLSQIGDIEAFLKQFITTLRELRESEETDKLYISISGGRKSMTYAVTWGLLLSLPKVVVDGVWHVQIPREGPEYQFPNLLGLTRAQRRPYLYPPDAELVPLPYPVGQSGPKGIPVRETQHPTSPARMIMGDLYVNAWENRG